MPKLHGLELRLREAEILAKGQLIKTCLSYTNLYRGPIAFLSVTMRSEPARRI